MRRLTAGLDLGSTGIKVLIADEGGSELLVKQLPTPWRNGPSGTTDLTADALTATLKALLQEAAQLLSSALPRQSHVVEAISISGMGETGILLDQQGVSVAPAAAWFDPRGQQEIDALPPQLREQFAGRTGLPLGAQVSVAKLLYLRAGGLNLSGLRWFNLPEFVAATLGASSVSEYSLASRTGLLDQDTGEPWVEMLDHLGVDDRFLPPLVDAGTDVGAASATWLPPEFAGARISVAGHDHLVSAVSAGGITQDRYHVSMGTAEVLLRVLDNPLSPAARQRLAGHLINTTRHVVPGKHVLVAGVKTGLLMRRALQLCGITDRVGRDQLDGLAAALPLEGSLPADAIEVSGARNDDGVMTLTVRADGVSPAELFNAVLRHGNAEIQRLIDAMDSVIPAARSTLLTGGWADMVSVQRARAAVLPQVTVSHRNQDTAYGAAMIAAQSLARTRTPPDVAVHSASPTTRAPHARRPRGAHQMNQLTTIERRGLAAISTPSGRMLIVAADQRNGMKAVMNDAPDGPSSITVEQLADAKADLVRHLGNNAPAILLDPEVALPRVVDDSTLARDTALVVGMDASGFDTVDGLRYTRLVEGISARRVRELGGDVAKMLWYMRPDKQAADTRLLDEIRGLVKSCEAEGLLLIVEILTYRLDGESEQDYASAFAQLVEDAAKISVECGAKVLKLQYPGSAQACAAVSAAASGVPWAVLSAGVDHATFIKQVAAAVANGASGAMAGRSLWKDSLAVSAQVREDLLVSRALPRLRELASVVDGTQVPSGTAEIAAP